MMRPNSLGGRFTFGKTSLTVNRMGYGAMQLAGPGVWGPPKDPDGCDQRNLGLRERVKYRNVLVGKISCLPPGSPLTPTGQRYQ
jgi:hypothetical protein